MSETESKGTKRPREGEAAPEPPEKQSKEAPENGDKADGGEAPLWGSFTKAQRRSFYSILSKWGMSDPKWKNVEKAMPEKPREEILAYVAVFMLHLSDASLGVFNHLRGSLEEDGVPQTADEVKSLMERIALIHLIHQKTQSSARLDPPPPKDQPFFAQGSKVHKLGFRQKGRVAVPEKWPFKVDHELLQGLCHYGYAQWSAITEGLKSDTLSELCPRQGSQQEEVTWASLDQESRTALTSLVEARLCDLADLITEEHRLSHTEGPVVLGDEARARGTGGLAEKIERRRQMVDEWAYHEPMVGRDFQATVPRILKECSVNTTCGDKRGVYLHVNHSEAEEGRLVWDGHTHADAMVQEWLSFVDEWMAKTMPPGSAAEATYEYKQENALELLQNNGGDVERAVESLPLGPAAICNEKVRWTAQELETFQSAYDHHGKDFHAICAMLPDKDFKQVAHFYFDHKLDLEERRAILLTTSPSAAVADPRKSPQKDNSLQPPSNSPTGADVAANN